MIVPEEENLPHMKSLMCSVVIHKLLFAVYVCSQIGDFLQKGYSIGG